MKKRTGEALKTVLNYMKKVLVLVIITPSLERTCVCVCVCVCARAQDETVSDVERQKATPVKGGLES
jgi:hypothetical protein